MNKKLLGVVGALGGLALVTLFVLIYPGDNGEVADPAEANVATLPAPAPPPLAESATLAPAAAPSARNMVEVQGAVVAPGSYGFPGDARVFDAIEKAGGTLENAEIRDLNIAATLLDGSVLSVPYRQANGRAPIPGAADLNPPAYTRSGWNENPASPGAVVPGVAAPPAGAPKINLNTATQAELETLPGVGEKTAEKIMRFREAQPFTQVDDLRHVQGIGDKRMETLRPHVTVD